MNNAVLSTYDEGERDRASEIGSSKLKALLRFSASDIQTLPIEQIAELQSLLRHGSTPGVWETPADWLPPTMRVSHRKSADLRQRILHHIPKSIDAASPALASALDYAVLSLTRYLLLLRIGPAGMGRKGKNRSLDVTTISAIAHWQGPAMYALALSKLLGADGIGVVRNGQLLAALSNIDFSSRTTYTAVEIRKESERVRMLCSRELWLDAPTFQMPSRAEAMNGAPINTPKPRERDSHLPFPDDYLSQMAERSIWLMQHIGPHIIAVAQQMAAVWDTPTTNRPKVTKKILAKYVWRDRNGQELKKLPFEFRLQRRSKAGAPKPSGASWPPRNYLDVLTVLSAVQMAHYFIVALSMGARASEALSLQRRCVVYSADGRPYAHGLTFKLVRSFEGEVRDWRLPKIAVDAIEQQARLVALAERIPKAGKQRELPAETASEERQHLWAEISTCAKSNAARELRNINDYLKRYAKTLGLSVMPGGQNIRSHRFRKTLARLVALALTQAPKILMDVFGHKSIEMTLYYILTDKELRAEIETVMRELRVMRAKEVVERMVEAQLEPTAMPDLGGYGGLGAVTLSNAVSMYRDRVHRRGENWGASSAYELAELLTMQGTAWEQVRPGVLCTKFPGEAGPCNKSKGRPEPSRCQSTCGHRLEEAFHREDVDGAIADCVEHYERAIADGEDLMAAHWSSQVRAHLERFADLKTKWLRNASVRTLVSQPNAAAL